MTYQEAAYHDWQCVDSCTSRDGSSITLTPDDLASTESPFLQEPPAVVGLQEKLAGPRWFTLRMLQSRSEGTGRASEKKQVFLESERDLCEHGMPRYSVNLFDLADGSPAADQGEESFETWKAQKLREFVAEVGQEQLNDRARALPGLEDRHAPDDKVDEAEASAFTSWLTERRSDMPMSLVPTQ